MMLSEKKKTGFAGGCIVPILAVVGFVALCYVFCFAIYLLNTSVVSNGSSTGGMLLPTLY